MTGAAVKLSSADAKALNRALRTTVYKSGKKFGTLSYSGIVRELIASGGSLTLCNDKKLAKQNKANHIAASPVAPATPVTTGCTGTHDNSTGIKFPEPGRVLGFLDTATGHGRLTLKGGIKDTNTNSSISGEFTHPIVDLLGANSDLRATVTSLGPATIGTVEFTRAPTVEITSSGGRLTSKPDSVTTKLNGKGPAF